MDAIAHPSPNFGPRRDGLTPQFIVLHYTAMESAAAALERLCDPEPEVSAHYLIAGDGTLYQLVDEAERAWHAGQGSWCGLDDMNSRSIGIELDNRGDHPFSHPQMCTLEALLSGIMQRWSIAPSAVIGHSDMAPGRKVDPGKHFDWQRLVRLGLAAATRAVDVGEVSVESFRDAAGAGGYSAEASDDALLEAVRLRNRPYGSGPLTSKDYTFPT